MEKRQENIITDEHLFEEQNISIQTKKNSDLQKKIMINSSDEEFHHIKFCEIFDFIFNSQLFCKKKIVLYV